MTDSDIPQANRETRDGTQPKKSKIPSWVVFVLFVIGEAMTPTVIFFVVLFLGQTQLWALTWGRFLDNLPSTCADPNVMSLVVSYFFIPSVVIGVLANVVLWRRKGHPYLLLLNALFFLILLFALGLTFGFSAGLSDC
jgi:hypothetical protein